VVIVRGDTDADPASLRELGRAAAGVLVEYLGDNMTVAVSGGATMAWVAEAVSAAAHDVTVVPARGGLGEKVELQANTIAAVMAGKLGGRYRMLHIPDGVSGEALDVLLAHDAKLRTVDAMIRQADVVLHGIGLAEVMAARRVIDPLLMNELRAKGAAGEALGHYATLTGEIIHTTDNIGLRLEELPAVGRVIAVAGGRKKAAAIVAVTAAGSRDVLVTDEGAALAIREILKG
jgi:central glycolytic genes regulator